MADYLHNAWYVAAWSEELGGKPLGRVFLDTPVALYRGADGRAAAVLDRCPHRFAPLSRGRVDGSHLVCGYHGLRVDRDGTCVDQRLAAGAREAARVRSFPLVERDSILWIWMGDPAKADASQIIDFKVLADPHYRVLRGSMTVNANYLLEIENLMDLSHLDYLHLGSIANGSLSQGRFSMEEVGETIHARWDSPNCPILPQFVRFLPDTPLVDQWTDFRWDAPGTLYLRNGVTRPGAPRSEGVEVRQGHFVTPQSEKSCHYFWSVAQQADQLTEELVAPRYKMIRDVFETEDKPMLEAQQATLGGVDLWAGKPVLFPEDAAAVKVRKILERRIREEQQAGG